MGTHTFKSEVSQLLHLIIHSLYSHKEVFLRELISNASDALDKLRYLSLSDAQYKDIAKDFKIEIFIDEKDKKSIELRDNGIGMNEKDLKENLGTIARSGTKAFMDAFENKKAGELDLIGQFGVGFYSAFMVAQKVECITRKAGEEETWKWSSDGTGRYTIQASKRDAHGTTIRLLLNDAGKEYANSYALESLIKKFSNHVPFPIYVGSFAEPEKLSQVNEAKALWQRNKQDLQHEDYVSFFKGIYPGDEDPLLYLHTKAEGVQEYTTLFYVPTKAPFDMFNADYRSGVSLYVKRVFITNEKKELLPSYLRFVQGIIDSEDLPLNVSREILQESTQLNAIRNASVKKLLQEFEKLATVNPEKFDIFIKEYNKPLKEGLYSDFAQRDQLLKIVRFPSSVGEGLVSLADYVSRMPSDQKEIYYISGGSEKYLRNAPMVQSYIAQGKEVLLMIDEIDEVIIPMVGSFEDHQLKAVNRVEDKKDTDQDETAAIVAKLKEVLGDKVKDVRVIKELASVPACAIWDSSDPSKRLQDILKLMGQEQSEKILPILGVNPEHPVCAKLAEIEDADLVQVSAETMLFAALLAEGIVPEATPEYLQSLHAVLQNAVTH